MTSGPWVARRLAFTAGNDGTIFVYMAHGGGRSPNFDEAVIFDDLRKLNQEIDGMEIRIYGWAAVSVDQVMIEKIMKS